MSSRLLIGMKQPVRLLWPALDKPKVFRGADGRDSAPYFEATLMIPNDHPDLAAIRRAIADEAKARLLTNPRSPLRDGNEMAATSAERRKAAGKEPGDQSFMNGHQLLRTRSVESRPPRVFDARSAGVKAREMPTADEIRALAYSGAFVAAVVNLTAYTGMGGGVTAYLNEIAVAQDGPRLGGMDYAEVFANIAGRQPTTAFADDEVAF